MESDSVTYIEYSKGLNTLPKKGIYTSRKLYPVYNDRKLDEPRSSCIRNSRSWGDFPA